MYTLKDDQIDFILNDIKSRGVEIEDLQMNLLDHICCIIEKEFTGDEDFKTFYQKILPRFFKKELKEIEEETINLLTFKNYYAMKKTMITTGIISVSAFILGSIFKIMHWPGAGVLLVLGIACMSLVFLPLMFILKTRDNSSKRDKLVSAVGALVGMILCMAVMFTVMHWGFSSGLWFTAVSLSFFVLIPLYFFTGIRNPETKVNTVVTTIILIGATGLLFTMLNTRTSAKQLHLKMYNYIQGEELLGKMQMHSSLNDSNNAAAEINKLCSELKKLIVVNALGDSSIPKDFDKKGVLMEEGNLGFHFEEGQKGRILFEELKKKVKQFNSTDASSNVNKIPFDHSLLAIETDKIIAYNNYVVLTGLTQLQMYALK